MQDYTHTYTLALALTDFLPVAAGGLGMLLITRYAAALGRAEFPPLLPIPLVIFTGGLLKASWKTWVVVSGQNVTWMTDQLFFFLASGYVMMAALVTASLGAHKRQAELSAGWWRLPLTIVMVLVASALYLRFTTDGRGWNFLLLGVLSLANLVLFVRLIAHSIGTRNLWSAAGFTTSLVLGYVLVGLARMPDQTLQLQWVAQTLNFVSNSILALSAWYLIKTGAANER